MRYIAAEDIARAKEMDLLTYLRNYEPQELVHVSGNTYCTREHDSLRISNGKWCWFSQGIGGRSALDYLIKVKGIPFTQAAEIILGREAETPPVFYRQKERKHTNLLMPELSETTDCVEKYLQGRGIHPVIIRYCLDNKLLFESADYHNAMFVGYDKDGKARYGALRSTVSSYKGELTGSDKHFSFFLEGKPNAEHIHVFESAIDLLSFATLALLAGRDWKSETYEKAQKLVAMLADYPNLVFEGHSTDYQTEACLRHMVEDGIAILKVGPALTFGYRDALFALSHIEQALIPAQRRANFPAALEQAMLNHPENWQKHYHGTPEEQRLARSYSLSDRARYYIGMPEVVEAIDRMMANLKDVHVPLGLIYQYFPQSAPAVLTGACDGSAEKLLEREIMHFVNDYIAAAGE